MLLGTITLVNGLVYASMWMLLLWSSTKLPLFIVLGAVSIVVFFSSNKSAVKDVVKECEYTNTRTACSIKGQCFLAKDSLDIDYEWARYRRNMCSDVTANANRLIATYSVGNCEHWGGCADEDCLNVLRTLETKIKDFECPFDEDRHSSGERMYNNTNERSSKLYTDFGLNDWTHGVVITFLVLLVFAYRVTRTR